MAIGDDALAAGFQPVNGASTQASDIDQEINRVADWVAQRTSNVTPVAKGGTGATTAAQARTNLGLTAANTPSGTSSNVQADLNYLADEKADKYNTFRTDQTYDRGTIDGAFASRDGHINNLNYSMGGKRNYDDGYFPGDVNASNVFARGAYAANSNYVIAYMNGDNRLSRGASSERYKKFISAIDPDTLGEIFPELHQFKMRANEGGSSDEEWKHGYIAERLAEHPDLEKFVVYNEDGQPDSIDFIGLFMAQISQLHKRATEAEAKYDDLAARVAALEATAD